MRERTGMAGLEIVDKLRELRHSRGLSQRDVARKTGLGVKTISSFETGERIESMKISQLRRILKVYGVSERDFFSRRIEPDLAPWEADDRRGAEELLDDVCALPGPVMRSLITQFRMMVRTVSDLQTVNDPRTFQSDWHLLAPRN